MARDETERPLDWSQGQSRVVGTQKRAGRGERKRAGGGVFKIAMEDFIREFLWVGGGGEETTYPHWEIKDFK